MFEFYSDCTFPTENNSSLISILIQLAPIVIAFIALIIAYYNFKDFRQVNSVQTHLDLINLENDTRKKHSELKTNSKKLTDYSANSTEATFNALELERLSIEKINSFELYISSVDKLASLINTDYLKGQFNKRDWKAEYLTVFQNAKDIFNNETNIIPGRNEMVKNLNTTLNKWNEN